MKNLSDLVLRYALQNAYFYKGRANSGAIMGKLLSKDPKLRNDMETLKKEIDKAVEKVNSLSAKKQEETLNKMSPEMMVKQQKKQDDIPPLVDAVMGKFVTRFAPSPSGPLNLGQFLRAAMLPYLYVKKYKGKFILRIEDTDPRNIEQVFYSMIMEDLMSTGVKWDKMVKESDHMDDYYRYIIELLNNGKAYVCTCEAEKFRELKLKKETCECRELSPAENMSRWDKMINGYYEEGDAVVRLSNSMSDPNPTLRDPPLLRVIKETHPLKGEKYKVWPLYNFACTIEDHDLKMTHVFRGKEHEHNTAIQKLISDAFGWEMQIVINFGMIYLPGTKLHTRDMKDMIKDGRVDGWDDPRLPTVRALLRRGFQPEALKKFAQVCGMSKTDIKVGWENLEGINRKIIDSLSNRFMSVLDPVKISVKYDKEVKEALVDFHPDFPKRGKKAMPVDLNSIFVSNDDYKQFSGKTVRLKGLFNVKLGKVSKYAGDEVVTKMPKIQWVSYPNIPIELLTPDKKFSGVGELGMKKLKIGTLIQLERIGFVRIDDVKSDKIICVFAHK